MLDRLSDSSVPLDLPAGPWGVLAALEPELGNLMGGSTGRGVVLGVPLREVALEAGPLLLAVGGVGKVQAAAGAAALLAGGARGLLIVGTCGGLSRELQVGEAVHCAQAFQADLAVRETRQAEAHAGLLAAWREVVPGPAGWFLTADRPVLTPWRRLRLARAFRGACVADMETAAAAAVAQRAGAPWAALRAVSDRAGWGSARSFREQLPRVGGLAADSVPELLTRIGVRDGSGPRVGYD